MGLIHAGLLLVMCSVFTHQLTSLSQSQYGPSIPDPEEEWNKMEKAVGDEMAPALGPRSGSSSVPSALKARTVPGYLIVSADMVQKHFFKPEKGARPLSNSVKEMLLAKPPTGPPPQSAARQKTIEILCLTDRMYVRIRREVFKTIDAYKYLKLGTCPVTQNTKDHYYLLYLLKMDCGFTKEINADFLNIKVALHFQPSYLILREMPFHIPLQCKYPRWFHSYKVGFYPKLQGGTVFKSLTQKNNLILIAQDASGNELTGSKVYTVGQTMYFEAKRSDDAASSGDERIYINKCFITASQDPNSSPQVTIIDHHGCMSDSMLTRQSRFLTSTSKMTQRFSVGAFVFKDMVSSSPLQQLYTHCDISVGELDAAESSKACNYDAPTNMWNELYGDDSVCACCKTSSCSAQPRASGNVVTSGLSWKVDFKGGNVEFDPRMTSLDTETSIFHDPTDRIDLVEYWED